MPGRRIIAVALAGCASTPVQREPPPPAPAPYAYVQQQPAQYVPPPPPPPSGPPPPRIVRLSVTEPSCGLDGDGQVWSWASGAIERDAPSIRGATRIACNGSHSCVAGSDGHAYCWGNNGYGALGDGTEVNRDAPVQVVGLSDVADVAGSYGRSCARTVKGDVYCWGDSEFGKAGDGRLPDNDGREKTAPGKPILRGAATLAVGMAHACSAMADGGLSCWGQNNSGAIGLPERTRYVPRPQLIPGRKDIAVVATGESVTCALDRAGKVACWGNNIDGVLGPSVTDETPWSGRAAASPIPLPEPAIDVTVGTGGEHACALLASHTVACWGNGELGNGSKPRLQRDPAVIAGLHDVVQVTGGLNQTCAIDTAGAVWCWGKDIVAHQRGSRDDALVPHQLRTVVDE